MTFRNVERWLKPVAQGAAVAFTLWLLGNRFRVNGVGWLERQGWPFSSGPLFVVAGAAIGAVVGLVRGRTAAARSRDAEAVARTLGFAFQPEVSREELGAAGELWTFRKWTAGANRQTGLADGLPVEMLDFTRVEKVNKKDREFSQTVVLLPADGLPVFELRPRSPMLRFLGILGMQGVTFDPDHAPSPDARAVGQFGRSYFLSGGVDAEVAETTEALADGEAVPGPERHESIRRLFTTEVLRYFAANAGWCVDCDGERLAVWRPQTVVPAARRERFLAKALQVRRAVVGGAGVVVPGSSGVRETAATQGRLLGAVLGIIGGFCLAFSSASRVWDALGVLMPVCFFGAIAAGVVAGWFLGGLALTPVIEVLNRRQQAARERAAATSPWRQPYGSTAVVEEAGGLLTVRFPPGGLIRGGGCGLLAACVLVNLFLAGFSALFVPEAMRGEVRWNASRRAGQPASTLAPWQALLFLTPFWLAGGLLVVALVYRARRRAVLTAAPDALAIEEATLFSARRHAWRREDLAAVRAVGEQKAKSASPRLYLVVITEKEVSAWLGWRDRAEVKWLADLVRTRLGLAAEEGS